ncbi:MAG: hypothetical protein WED07_13150 [Candidatus Freyarchaeum deiterrae]
MLKSKMLLYLSLFALLLPPLVLSLSSLTSAYVPLQTSNDIFSYIVSALDEQASNTLIFQIVAIVTIVIVACVFVGVYVQKRRQSYASTTSVPVSRARVKARPGPQAQVSTAPASAAPAQGGVLCPYCGFDNVRGAKLCVKCGKTL